MQPASGAPSEDKQSNQTSAMFLGRPRRHQSRTDTPRRRLAGRGRDRRGPLHLHGAADDVRGDAAADVAQGPPDRRGSAERLTPPAAGAGRPEAMAAAPPSPAQESDVRHRGSADHLDILRADRSTVQTFKQTLAAPEEDGHDRQVQLVDETGAQAPLDRPRAAPQADTAPSPPPHPPRQRPPSPARADL